MFQFCIIIVSLKSSCCLILVIWNAASQPHSKQLIQKQRSRCSIAQRPTLFKHECLKILLNIVNKCDANKKNIFSKQIYTYEWFSINLHVRIYFCYVINNFARELPQIYFCTTILHVNYLKVNFACKFCTWKLGRTFLYRILAREICKFSPSFPCWGRGTYLRPLCLNRPLYHYNRNNKLTETRTALH